MSLVASQQAGAEVTITGTQKTGSDYDHDLSDFDYRSVDMRNGEELDALIASTEGTGRTRE